MTIALQTSPAAPPAAADPATQAQSFWDQHSKQTMNRQMAAILQAVSDGRIQSSTVDWHAENYGMRRMDFQFPDGSSLQATVSMLYVHTPSDGPEE